MNRRGTCEHCKEGITELYPTPGEQPYWEDSDGESACLLHPDATEDSLRPHEPHDATHDPYEGPEPADNY